MGQISNCKVDVLVGGVSKAGTTALYEILQQNPNFYLPKRKELHYFSRTFLEQAANGPGDKSVLAFIPKTYEQYISQFDDKSNNQISIDISPSYFFYYRSADVIHKYFPDSKMIFILRNPVDKVFSQYVHLVSEARETQSFEEALKLEAQRKKNGYSDMWLYTESGLYTQALEHFISIFGREKIHLVLYDDFLNNPLEVMRGISAFCGVSSDFKYNCDIKSNVSSVPKSFYLAALIGPNMITNALRLILPLSLARKFRNFIRKMNSRGKPTLNNETRTFLQLYFRNDVQDLEKLIGRKTGW